MIEKYKLSKKDKKIIFGGSKNAQSNNFWNNSIGFGIIGSTVLSILQFIFTIVTSFVSNDESNQKTSNYSPNYSKSKISYRLSKYPSKSNIFM